VEDCVEVFAVGLVSTVEVVVVGCVLVFVLKTVGLVIVDQVAVEVAAFSVVAASFSSS